MYKQNQGYGICGAKNIYSSKVKVDNWVEDNIGMSLAMKTREPPRIFQTCTKESFIDPNDRPSPPSMPVNMPSTQELKSKNKDGLPYSILFSHGAKDMSPEVIHAL